MKSTTISGNRINANMFIPR